MLGRGQFYSTGSYSDVDVPINASILEGIAQIETSQLRLALHYPGRRDGRSSHSLQAVVFVSERILREAPREEHRPNAANWHLSLLGNAQYRQHRRDLRALSALPTSCKIMSSLLSFALQVVRLARRTWRDGVQEEAIKCLSGARGIRRVVCIREDMGQGV